MRSPPVDSQDAARLRAERRLRSLGIARPGAISGPGAIGGISVPAGVGVPVEVEGAAGPWVADPELLDRQFAGRAALLSPFDRLVYDRERAMDLFGFDYRL